MELIVCLHRESFDFLSDVLQTVRHFHISPAVIQSDRQLSPEDGNQRGVDRVSVIDVHVVPAALGGKMIEAQPEHCIRAERENIKGSSEMHLMNI